MVSERYCLYCGDVLDERTPMSRGLCVLCVVRGEDEFEEFKIVEENDRW